MYEQPGGGGEDKSRPKSEEESISTEIVRKKIVRKIYSWRKVVSEGNANGSETSGCEG